MKSSAEMLASAPAATRGHLSARYHLQMRWAQHGCQPISWIAIAATGAALGIVSVNFGFVGLLAALGVLLVAILARDPAVLPVLALPATIVQVRVGDALSVSDLVLVGATAVAVLMLRRQGAGALRALIWAGAAYLASAIPTLLLNPYAANIVEWLHEIVLVLGSLVVGFVIGRSDRARPAFFILAVVSVGISLTAVVAAVSYAAQTGEFTPAYVLGLQKNAAGNLLAITATIALARPTWLRWSRSWAGAVLILCVFGILATQSRQALIGLVAGAVVLALRPDPRTGRRPKLVWLASVPAVVAVWIAVSQQLDSDNRFNSVFQRLDWFEQSIGIWQISPLFGVGLRWWYTTRFQPEFDLFQPPNAILEVLTETGLFGAVGFLTMFIVAACFLWRMNPVYGSVGLAVVVCRFTQGQLDLYWVAGQASLLWIVAGACVGVEQLHRALGAQDSLLTDAERCDPRQGVPQGKGSGGGR